MTPGEGDLLGTSHGETGWKGGVVDLIEGVSDGPSNCGLGDGGLLDTELRGDPLGLLWLLSGTEMLVWIGAGPFGALAAAGPFSLMGDAKPDAGELLPPEPNCENLSVYLLFPFSRDSGARATYVTELLDQVIVFLRVEIGSLGGESLRSSTFYGLNRRCR